MRGADRIPIDTACFDPRSPSPFYSVVKADHDRLIAADEGIHEQAEQLARQPAAGPDVTVKHAVIFGKVPDLIEPHDAQDRGDGAPTGHEDRSRYQESTCRHVGAVNPARDGSGTDSTTSGLVRIRYDITSVQITQEALASPGRRLK